jgi:glycosyltransferase involved in cell wall biosynthesis
VAGVGGEFQFHVLSFEGPDRYARAGGLAKRITGLTAALATAGHGTHLWFVGAPDLPGHESRPPLSLHRWCQWISRYHPGGVYDGEEGKCRDYSTSLPPFLTQEVLLPYLLRGPGRAVVMAEEWQTVGAVLHLDRLLRRQGLREHVALLWNANSTLGFHRIDWRALRDAAVVTTVSRYMRQQLWALGVDPVVIPNGLPAEVVGLPDRHAVQEFHHRTRERFVLAKLARYEPDKRWLLAVDTTALLRDIGWRPLLLARGGAGPQHADVLARAAGHALRVAERGLCAVPVSPAGLLETLTELDDIDILILQGPLLPDARTLLYRGANAVLANSCREPFGLVGLEAMAAGGVVCLGGTGEDYGIPGWNSLMLLSDDPREFVEAYARLVPADQQAMRDRAMLTARRWTWADVIERNLLPRLELLLSRRVYPRLVQQPSQRRRHARSAGGRLPVVAGSHS